MHHFLSQCQYSSSSNLLKIFQNEFHLSSDQCQVCHIDFDRIGSCWNKSQEKRKTLNIATEIVLPIVLGLVMIFHLLIVANEAGNKNSQNIS